MESHVYRRAVFAFLLATVYVYETLANSIKRDPALTQVLEVQSNATILAPIVCNDEKPFPDPADTTGTWYYQCFWSEQDYIWGVFHLQCPDGGYFDKDHLICLERPTVPIVCKDENPFADPADTTGTWYYQCFWFEEGYYWWVSHEQCPPGGYFDKEMLACVERPTVPIVCKDENPFADPADPTGTWYYQCFWIEYYWFAMHGQCPPGGYFDSVLCVCIATI
ncbi:uncharacterized protein LOC110857760 [Folsomia candida]|uniref:uncharacterized protein LOC110857760 n=1 Tax=Folsomia candida TaxID=158441 RepID=UPI000B8F286F|nr:uncharacterized protein LOC110857760 [Folsomia candida]